jgi:phosphoenolpyruvate-protein phosphotransferase
MSHGVITGFAASPGRAAGPAVLLGPAKGDSAASLPAEERAAELEMASRALEATAGQIEGIAEELRAAGREVEADVVDTGAQMARDPMLAAEVNQLVMAEGRPAPAAIVEASESIAAQLAALPDPLLAERADDVRSVGRRAAARAAGTSGEVEEGVLVAEGLGPADVAEIGPQLRGIALAAGGVTAHAAIVARSLGVPMVVGLGDAVLELHPGEPVIVDGDRGELMRFPSSDQVAAAQLAWQERRRAREAAVRARGEPARTKDGTLLKVLCNAASVAEVEEGLAQGAEGVGLLRTELGFLDARAWPSADEHFRFLRPLLAELAGRIATVRLLDFGGDKTPPFLAGEPGRGVELLLGARAALRAQMEAIVRASASANVRILIPMVTTVGQVLAVREVLSEVVGGAPLPQLGAMIETPAAALAARDLAPVLDFFSLGTNDLTQLALGLDRERSTTAPVAHPDVLRLVAAATRAGRSAGIPVEVCGEAASDPDVVPLLIGLGADELSVGAARVGEIRELVRSLDAGESARLAEKALLGQVGHARGQRT